MFLCLYGVHLGVLQRLGGTGRVAVARCHLIRKSNCVPASASAPFCPVFVICVQLRNMIEDAESDDNFQQSTNFCLLVLQPVESVLACQVFVVHILSFFNDHISCLVQNGGSTLTNEVMFLLPSHPLPHYPAAA